MSILRRYENGNCVVTLHDDGTKIREWPDGTTANPGFPESVDLKITNTCDRGCAWCHEKATREQAHAPVDRIVEMTKGLHSGVEIAIGGGNPLSHPHLKSILQYFKELGLISNITVHGDHVAGSIEYLKQLQREQLLYGVGISNPRIFDTLCFNRMLPQHCVGHAIVGIDNPFTILAMTENNTLILGYKSYGRGKDYHNENVDKNLATWRYFITTVLRQPDTIFSFDNLALDQLNIKDLVPPDVWTKHYMGDDGKFTMYVDAVLNQYAASSVDERKDAGAIGIPQMFQDLKT